MVGSRLHRRRPTKELQKGPAARRGRKVPNRGRCVCCYVNAPKVAPDKRKTKMEDGKNIPVVTLACDVCRKLLCRSCFYNPLVYDHSSNGKLYESVTL